MYRNTLILLTLYSIFASCQKDFGCDGPSSNYCERERYIPNLMLNDSNSIWLNAYKNSKITLIKNNFGFVDTLLSNPSKKQFKYSNEVYRVSVAPWQECCIGGQGYYVWYCNVEYENCLIKSSIGTGDISFYRTKTAWYPQNSDDSIAMYNQTEQFYLYKGNKRFQFYPYLTNNYLNQRYYPSFQLNNKTFSPVYEVLDTLAGAGFNSVQSIYYNFQFGVLGYKLTNGETWAIE